MSRYESTREAWQAVGEPQPQAVDFHRRQVMARLLPATAVPNGRLCILGAGPCNDLDLAALQARWSQVDLVDIDSSRVQQGVTSQVADARGIQVLTQDLLWGDHPLTPDPASKQNIGRTVRERISAATWSAVGQDYDLIASTCLLSQLIEQVIEIIGSDAPEFVATIQTLRRRHFELMARALRSGGTGWLFCDFVSSETLPELLSTVPQALPQLLEQALTEGNFFHGLNPGILLQVLRQDEHLTLLVDQSQITNPWVWLTGERAYAVVGIRFIRV
ncbi:MAG: hypothetical protein Q8M16_18440 [Pirellulaceae bacterium]|nr:hypothetical protein [Pirellulaceae bacterium]